MFFRFEPEIIPNAWKQYQYYLKETAVSTSPFPLINSLSIPKKILGVKTKKVQEEIFASLLKEYQPLFLDFLVRTYAYPWTSTTEQKGAAAVLFRKKQKREDVDAVWKATYQYLNNLEIKNAKDGVSKVAEGQSPKTRGEKYPDGFSELWDASLQNFKENRLIRETWVDFDLADRAQYSEDYDNGALAKAFRKERQEYWISIYEDPWRLTRAGVAPLEVGDLTPENYAESKGFGNLVSSLRMDRSAQKEGALNKEKVIVYHGVTIVDVHQILGASWDNVLIVKSANPNKVAEFLLRLRAHYPSISNTRTATRVFYRSQWSMTKLRENAKQKFAIEEVRKVLVEYRKRLKDGADASFETMSHWYYGDKKAQAEKALGTFNNIYTCLKKAGILREWVVRSFNSHFFFSKTGEFPTRYWVLVHLCNPPKGLSEEIFLDKFEDQMRLEFFFQPCTNPHQMILKSVQKHIGADFSILCEVLSSHEDATSDFIAFLLRRNEVKQTHTVSVLVKPEYLIKRADFKRKVLPDFDWEGLAD